MLAYRKWYRNTPKGKEVDRVHGQRYRKANRDRCNTYARQWREKNREIARGYDHRSYERNRERVIERKKHYSRTHREKINAMRKRAYLRDPLPAKVWCSNRRARLRKAGKLSVKVVRQLFENNILQYGLLTCYLCGKGIELGQASIDHKIPLARGGTNHQDNLAVAHVKCNASKNAKTHIEYWMSQI